MTRCLYCTAPADFTLRTSGTEGLPAGLLVDVCAHHAASPPPVIECGISIGAFYGTALGFALTLGAFLLLWKVFG